MEIEKKRWEEKRMRCAFYEKEITPPLGGDIPGYYANRFTEDVEDELFARAVVFAPDEEDPAGTLALLTLDACCTQKALADAIKARITEFTGIPYENVAVIANHSHYGIPHGDVVSLRDEEYMSLLRRLAADAVILAYKRLKPCTLKYGIGYEDRVAFVRDCVLDDGHVVTNPGKAYRSKIVRTYDKADTDLPVLSVYDEENKPMGAIFSYPLHQDTTGGLRYSGDFSSEAAKQLKARYGQSFGSVFVPGFCGDINHYDFVGGRRHTHREIGGMIAETVMGVMEEKSEAVTEDCLKIRYTTLALGRRLATKEQIEHCKYVLEDPDTRRNPYIMLGARAYREQLKYAESYADHSGWEQMPLQVMCIGGVWFYITPNEIYHRYADPLKSLTPGGKWMISEMANREGSYVPVTELMNTEIYPAWLCYGSWLEVEAGNKIVAALSEMVKEMQ